MIPELGHLCVIIACSMCVLQLCLAASRLRVNIMPRVAAGQSFFVGLAFAFLVCAFLQNDFSLTYVAQNSNSSLPWYYKITALWGAHEGSLLFWILELGVWNVAQVLVARKWSIKFSDHVFTIMALINLGFICILLFSSNPFLRQMQAIPIDGNDLNPLLQDLGMILHPPILYMGYVGCAIPFSLAMAGVWQGKLDMQLAAKMRPWVLATWVFLTLGIALGSFWAYYELGWGGWWFWDPVENASFMPWLTTTALLHCLAVSKKNGHLLPLVIMLAVVTFTLSLFGTFLVRSGAIISVHSFANDPARGVLILWFVGSVVLASLALLVWRWRVLQKAAELPALPGQGWMLANAILLLVITGTILLGTLYPLIHEAIFTETLSVGYPYFNAVVVPLVFLLLLCMFAALNGVNKKLLFVILCSACMACGALYFMFRNLQVGAVLGLTFAIGIVLTSCSKNIVMSFAHLGLAITIAGISITTQYEIERDILLRVGDVHRIAQFAVKFVNIAPVEGANYVGFAGEFEIYTGLQKLRTIMPEKRTYLVSGTAMSETAIFASLIQDVYIALGQNITDDTWSVRIYYKPFVRAIWCGAIVMALAGMFGTLKYVWPRPRRKQVAF